MKTDVVVIGGSAAGLAAAITAAEEGVKVALFEKYPYLGGIAKLGMGIAAVESRLQRERAFPFKRDDAFKLIMEHTDWRADARLVRAWVNEMPRTIEWLENLGVEFELLDIYQSPEFIVPTGHLVKRTTKVIMPPDEAKWVGVTGEVRITPDKPSPIEGGRTAVMTKIMAERARENGVEIFTSSPVRKILVENGRVTGVIAEIKGERTQVSCKSVVIASGGFCYNKEILKKYIGLELGTDIHVLHGVELTGDCIQMAWDLGAAQDYMAPAILTEPLLPYDPNLRCAFNQPFNLVVNQDGKRFINEEKLGANWVHLAYAMSRQKNKCAYVIFDEDIRRHMEEYGFEYIYYLFRPIRVKLDGKQFDEAVKKTLESRHSFLVVANSLEELAHKIGVDPSVLKETIEEYNSFCEKGYDALFNKNPGYLLPVKRPKYYATKYILYMYTTVGGIRINEKAEVINRNGEVILGLYAAGDCAASVLAYDFSLSYMLWGANLSFALNTGRIAGRNAASYAKSIG